MKKKLSLLVLTAVMALMIVFVGTAYAYYDETGPIDSQIGDVEAENPPYSIRFTANITSWYHARIVQTHIYEWEWITFENPPNGHAIYCYTSGTVFIGFESYITIKSFALTNAVGQASSSTEGGVGYSWLQIYISGTSAWDFTLTTNYIPSDYWGSTTNITLSAITGGLTDTTHVYLQI